MSQAPNIDGVLIQWGDRLFYPGNRIVKVAPAPRMGAGASQRHAAAIRARIEATVVRRAPQVMVKVTGGGRGMKAVAAHFRYISKNGRLEIEDQSGEKLCGKEVLPGLVDEWRYGGTLIPDQSHRREACNIMLSMPRGTDPLVVQRAAREFARTELADHKYLMVLHDHQANPHVHIAVRTESRHGKRLNPRKADLQRWRETFAEKLQSYGVDAEATRQATRARTRNPDALWRIKAAEEGRLRLERPPAKTRRSARAMRARAMEAWRHLAQALGASELPADRELARSITAFLGDLSVVPSAVEPSRLPELGTVPMTLDVGRQR